MNGIAAAQNKNPFDYQKPSDKQVEQITEIREKCKELYTMLCALPFTRETSLAKTKLEEVSMWANKGIVFAPELPMSPVTGVAMSPSPTV